MRIAGIDQAIYDQVDLLSGRFLLPMKQVGRLGHFYEDSVAIGSFSAMRQRILTVAAAGQRWAVGGNNTDLVGESAYQPNSSKSTKLYLAFPGYQSQRCHQQRRSCSRVYEVQSPSIAGGGIVLVARPSMNNGGILKPDIIGPGGTFLEHGRKVGPADFSSTIEPNFNFLGGTSVATPHVSALQLC
ncbi:hypothetical protein HPP92_021788 [Vanilla planifolia]|uniref:Peptidase S8/S53 domain-containing protein n=1 Tax=Vanilla planifolia TaxID=51239 RepID=A0A835PR24_VANPL|nr:hypothetical protein HPP92_021788 [Vanilla planifolia]